LSTFMAIVALVLVVGLAGSGAAAQDERSEAMSPFDSVAWLGEPGGGSPVTVRISIGGAWYELEAINGIAVPELLAGIERLYGAEHIVKRFEEDLIEAMEKLAIAPGERATLRVRGQGAAATTDLEAEWSREKRQNLRKAAAARNSRPRDDAVTQETVRATLDALEALIKERSAYAARKDRDLPGSGWQARLAAARARATSGAIRNRSALTREIRAVVAAIGDAHASVSGPEPESAGWLPFLPIALQSWRGDDRRVLAVKPDRSGFVADEAPFVVGIDGVPIRQWLDAAGECVADASPQLVAERSCRELRDIEALRSVVLPEAVGRREVRIAVASQDGSVKREVMLPLSATKPVYGAWPDRKSGLLEFPPNPPTGYIRLVEMDSQSAADALGWLKEFAEQGAETVVVDVRGNGGGSRDALYALAGAVLDPGAGPLVINAARPLLVNGMVPEDVAEQMGRRGLRPRDDASWSERERAAIARFLQAFDPRVQLAEERFDGWWLACIAPAEGEGAVRWSGQVVILQDAACFSATDVFLAAMKELPRVTLVGEASAGGSGAAREHELPQRLKVRLSSMVSVQPSGVPFDGFGVEPDVRIECEPGDVAKGEDRWVPRAVEVANGKR